jgi:hypothetical protein
MGDERSVLRHVDHLIVAAPDLDAAAEEMERRLGVRPAPGGRHPGRGTRNALIGLGPRCYLEILGPDPDQPRPAGKRWLSVDDATEPRLVSWAAKGLDLDRIVAQALAKGYDLGPVSSGHRVTPSGTTVRWRVSAVETRPGDGLVPFFIDWSDSIHPADALPGGAALVSLRAEHPSPDVVRAALEAAELPLEVTRGQAPALIAVLRTPKGDVVL